MYPDPVRGYDDIADLPGYGSPNRLFRDIDLVQYVASTLLNDSSQLGETYTRMSAVEQPTGELFFEIGNEAGQRRLRNGQLVRRGEDRAGIRDGKEPLQVISFFDHGLERFQ